MNKNLHCEHMTKELYDDACALWRHDPARNGVGQLWRIPGVHGGVLPYQAVGITWILLNLSRVNGVFCCDETGLGKTLQMILVFIFGIHIQECWFDCRLFWAGHLKTRSHLPKDHTP